MKEKKMLLAPLSDLYGFKKGATGRLVIHGFVGKFTYVTSAGNERCLNHSQSYINITYINNKLSAIPMFV